MWIAQSASQAPLMTFLPPAFLAGRTSHTTLSPEAVAYADSDRAPRALLELSVAAAVTSLLVLPYPAPWVRAAKPTGERYGLDAANIYASGTQEALHQSC